MVGVKGSSKLDTTRLDMLADGARRSPAIMKTIYERNTRRFVNRTMGKLKVIPPDRAPGEDIPWETPKQQRAFYASDGFGEGIPTPKRRPPRHIKAWKVKYNLRDPASRIEFYNELATAKFLFGYRQQKMHKGRFAYAPKVFKEARQEHPVIVEESWRTATLGMK